MTNVEETPELDVLFWAQAIDRAYVAARYAEEHLQEFEVFKQRPLLKARVDKIVDDLCDLYQAVANDEEEWAKEPVEEILHPITQHPNGEW